jgi:hypothetical protein
MMSFRRHLSVIFLLVTFAGLFGFGFFALPTNDAAAAIPTTLGYQGRLKNSSGNALTGTYNFTFRLYASSTGGTAVWTETQSVSVDASFFSVQLGSVTPFPAAVDFNQPLYISTQVSPDAEMSPRVPINSVAYAYTAGGVSSYVSAPVSATGGRMYYDASNGSLNYYDGTASVWRSLGVSTGTFQSVTDAGNVTTNPIQFGGGTSTGQFVVTGGGLSVTGQSILQDVSGANATFTSLTVTGGAPVSFSEFIWTNATGTNTTSTNFFSTNGTLTNGVITNGTIGSLSLTNGTSTSWFGFNVASGTSLYALNLDATNLNSGNVTLVGGTIDGISIGSITPSSAVFTNVTSTSATSTNLYATNAIFQNLTVLGGAPTTFSDLVWTNATGTNTTSTNLFASNLTGTNANLANLDVGSVTSTSWLGFNTASGTSIFTSSLQVSGQNVCLQNGTNCPPGSTTPTLALVTSQGATTTDIIYALGGLQTLNLTATGSVVLGNSTASNLAVQGTVSSDLNPSSDLVYTLGTATLRWNAELGSVTATSLVATAALTSQGTLVVTGQSTLGNVSSTNQSVSGSLNVLGLSDLGDLIFVNATGTDLYLAGSLYASSGTIATLNSTTLASQDASFTNSTSTNLYAQDGTITNLVSASATITNLTGTNSTFVNSTSTNLYATDATFQNSTTVNQYVTNQTVQTSTITDLTATNATLTNLTVTNLTVSSSQPSYFANLTWGNATGTNLVTTNATTTNLFAVTGDIDDLSSVTGTILNLVTTNGTIQDLSGTTLAYQSAVFTDTTSTNLFAQDGTITSLNSTDLVFVNGTSTSWFGFNVASGTSIYALSGTINNLTAPILSSSDATISGGSVNGTQIGNLVPSTAVFTNVTSTNSTSTNLYAQNATIGSLTLTAPLTVTDLIWVNATGTNTTSTNLFATNLTGTNADISALTVTGQTGLQGMTFTGATGTWLGATTVTSTNVFASSILVNGVAVCLDDGTNCPTGTSPDFQTVTNSGNTTTNAIQFAGGTSTASFLVQNTLTASGTLVVDGSVGSDLNPSSDLVYTLGTATLRWNAELGSVTATSLVATAALTSQGTLVVTGQSTLGNVSSTNQSVSGSLNVLGLSDLGDLIFVNATGTDLYLAGSLYASSGTIATLNSTTLASQDASFTNSTSTNLYAQDGTITNLVSASATITNLTGTNSTFVNSTSTNLYATDATFQNSTTVNQYVTNQTVQTSTITDLTATNATLTNLTVTNLTVSSSQPSYFANLTWGNATGTNLVTTNATTTNLFAVTGDIDDLSSVTGTILNLVTTNGTIQDLSGTTLAYQSAVFTDTTSTNLFAQDGTITSLNSTDLVFVNGTSTSWFGFNVASGTSIYALSGTINNLTAPILSSSDATISGGSVNGTQIGNLVPSTAVFTNVTSTNSTSTNLYAQNATIGSLTLTAPLTVTDLIWVNATGTNTTSTNLFATNLTGTNADISALTVTGQTGLQGMTFTGATGTWLGATTVTSTNVFASSILVNGVAVCLDDGTNCPTYSIPDAIWSESTSTNVVYLTTSTRDLLIGGNTTATAGLIFDYGTNGISSVFLGYATSVNLYVGTTTYSGGLKAGFAMDGNDVLVQGYIGSIGGLYSASAVKVGTNSTEYGDGYISRESGDFLVHTTSGNLTLETSVTGSIVLAPATSWILPSVDNSVMLGIETLRFKGEFSSVTSTNLVATNLISGSGEFTNLNAQTATFTQIVVNGSQPNDFTNLIWTNATGTNTTSTNLYAANATIASLTVTSPFTVVDLIWTNATGINTTTTNLAVLGGLSLPADSVTDLMVSDALTVGPAGSVSATSVNSGVLGNANVTLDLSGFGDIRGTLPASLVSYNATATTATLSIQQYLNMLVANGRVFGGDVTQSASGTIDVSAGRGIIASDPTNPGADVYLTDWASSTGISVPFNQWLYVYVSYNNGSPTVVATTTNQNGDWTYFKLAKVYNDGSGFLHLHDEKLLETRPINRFITFFEEGMGQLITEGCLISATGTRNLAISLCHNWYGGYERVIQPFDSSGSDTFDAVYRDGSGGFVFSSGLTQWDNINFDDGSGTLQPLSGGDFGVHWVYRDELGSLYLLYGQDGYLTLADALAAGAPSSLPAIFGDQEHVFLIGSVIFQSGDDSPSGIRDLRPRLVTRDGGSGSGGLTVSQHNDLSGLQGGTTGEYYHLTSSGFDAAGALSFSSGQGGYFSLLANGSTNTRVYINNTTIGGTASLDLVDGDLLVASTTRINNAGYAFLNGLDLLGGDITNVANLTVTGTSALALLSFTNATGTSIAADTGTFTSLSVSGAVPSSFDNLVWINATGTNTTSTNLFAQWANFDNIFGSNATFTNLVVMLSTSIQDLTFENATGGNLVTYGVVSSTFIQAGDTVMYNATAHNMVIDETLRVGVGGVPIIGDAVAQFGGSSNTFLQVNIQNRDGGDSASSDFVATNDIGDDESYYIDMGINSSGYNNVDYSIGGANDGYLYVNGNNLTIGTASASTAVIFHAGGTTAADEVLRITSDHYVGIGTTAPSSTLHVVGDSIIDGTLTVSTASSSILFFGQATGTELNVTSLARLPSDTRINGIAVCLLDGTNCPTGTTPSFQTVTNTGNTTTHDIAFNGGTSTSDFTVQGNLTVTGTTVLQGLTFTYATGLSLDVLNAVSTTLLYAGDTVMYNATAHNMVIDETLRVGVGGVPIIGDAVAQFGGSSNTFLQVNIQNRDGGDSASSDFVATNDIGDDESYYIDMGINSSGYNNVDYSIGGANDGYLYVNGNNLTIGTASASTAVIFHAGGTTAADEVLRITSDHYVGIGTTAPSSTLHVVGDSIIDGTLTVSTASSSILFFGQATGTELNVTSLARLPSDTRINGIAVCLLDGTNCPTGTTPSFQTVTNTGNTTTHDIAFNGGTSTSDFTVQGNLTVTGTTVLQEVDFVNATGDYLDIRTGLSKPAYAEGRLFYDDVDKSLAYYNDSSDITFNIGQETMTRVFNQTGSTIPNGQAVYVTGEDGDGHPTVALARADTEATSRAIGLATEDIPNASHGFITTYGLVHDLNTASYAAGAQLYLSAITSGAVTSVRPTAPDITVLIGNVVKVNATTGIILVFTSAPRNGHIQNGGLAFGSNSYITDDASNLFWDDSLNRLGIGTDTPSSTLHVVGDTRLQDLVFTTATGTSLTLTGGLTLPNLAVTGAATVNDLVWINATGTNTTSTNLAILDSARLPANTLVNGVAVCLLDGTNCPSSASPNLQTVTNSGNITTKDIQFAGGTSTGAFTIQSGLTVTGTSALQGLTFTFATGTSVSTTNLFASLVQLGIATTTDLAVLGAVNSNLNPSIDAYFSLGTSGLRWNAELDNVTSTSVTTTNLFATYGTIQNLTWTNGSGLNTTTTNLYSTNGTIQTLNSTDLVFTNGTSTNWFGFNTASGTLLNALQVNAVTGTFTFVTTTNMVVSGTVTTTNLIVTGGISVPSGSFEVQTEIKMTSAATVTSTNWTFASNLNTNYESVRSLQSFNGYLYAGMGDDLGDGDVQVCNPSVGGDPSICDNVADWATSTDSGTASRVTAMAVYNRKLYIGEGQGAGQGVIRMCDPALTGNAMKCESGDWTTVFSTGYQVVRQLVVYGDSLYASADNQTVSGQAAALSCDPAVAGSAFDCDNSADWTTTVLGAFTQAPAMAVYLNRLYIFMATNAAGGNDHYICDPTIAGNSERCDTLTDWGSVVNRAGYQSSESAAVYNNKMFIGQGNIAGNGDLFTCNPEVSTNSLLCDNASDFSITINLAGTWTKVAALSSLDGVLMIGYEGTSAGDGDITEFRSSYTTTTDLGSTFEGTYAFSALNGIIYSGRGSTANEGQVWYYRRARTVSNQFTFEAGSSTGNMWFAQEAYNWQGEGSVADINNGVFKLSHGLITEAGAYDLAEMYPAAESDLVSGDVVSLDAFNGAVKRSTQAYDGRAVGIISTKPGFLLSAKEKEGMVPVALAGRVPVKFSSENGLVGPGDPLTTASTTGYAMKATRSGFIIGRAAETFSLPEGASTSSAVTGTVVALIQPGYYFGSGAADYAGQLGGFLGDSSSTQIIEQAVSGDVAALLEVSGGTVNPQVAEGSDTLSDVRFAQIDVLVVRTAALIAGDLTVGGTVRLVGRILVAEDTAGVIDIPVGESYVEVKFKKPYQTVPVVVVTPESDAQEFFSPWMGRFRISKKTIDGFRIDVDEGTCLDPSMCGRTLRFNWMAVGSLGSATSTNDGASPEPTAVQPGGEEPTNAIETSPTEDTSGQTTEIPPAETETPASEPVPESAPPNETQPVTEPIAPPEEPTPQTTEPPPAEPTPAPESPPSETPTPTP